MIEALIVGVERTSLASVPWMSWELTLALVA